ncbi:MAG: PAS domain-containing protein, partial [Bacteroidales bacterium]
IVGWVYSPYRMNDLMLGILGPWDSPENKRIRLKVYDTDSISVNTLLFDSQKVVPVVIYSQATQTLSLTIDFNGTLWTLCFSHLKADLAFFESEVLLVSISGFIISLLLFGLALSLILTKTKARQIAEKLTSELKQSETKFKTVADYTYEWEYWESADYQLIYMSPSCERVSGYKPEEFVADPLLLKKIVHHEDLRFFEEHVIKVHSIGHKQELAEIGFRILKKDGSIVHIEHICSPVYDDKGGFTGRRISNRDITDAYHAQNLVFQTRRNYQTFFNTIDEFLFVLDKDGNIIHANSTVIDRLGFTWDELKNQSVLMVHPSDRRKEAGRIVALMLQGKAEFCLVPLITKSGMQIPVETRVTAGIWDGKPAIFGVTKDVSQIKLSQEKYLKLFHLNPSAAGLSDMVTGEYIEVNEAFYALFGFGPNEVIGKTAESLGILTDETRKNIFRKADIFGNISNLEADLIAKNGDIKHVLLSAENIYIQDKKYRFTVVNDITERRKSEKEKDELLGRLQKIASRLPGMVYQYKLHPDGSSCFPYTSDGINSIYRLMPDDVRYDASKVFERLHPDDFADVSSSIQASAKSLTAWRLEYRVKFDDGTIRWLSGNAIPQKETDGSILWHGFINDITESKQVSEALAEERKRLALILQGTNAGTWEWNIPTGETIYNERWANMIGYTLAEISPTNIETWTKFSHPDDLKISNELLAKHFNGEKDYYECESRMKHKDGSWVWILDRGKVNKWDADGKPLLMSGTHQLITDRKQA